MGAFKLGKMTFGSLFKKPETVKYPFEKKEQPKGLKGHIVIDVDTCILCGMCDRSCATDCISVDKKQRYWEINPFQCIQCGYCITVCPKNSLSMDPNYWAASVEQKLERFDIPEAGGGTKAKKSETPAKSVEQPKDATQTASGAVTATEQPTTTTTAPSITDKQVLVLLGQMSEEKAKAVESVLVGR